MKINNEAPLSPQEAPNEDPEPPTISSVPPKTVSQPSAFALMMASRKRGVDEIDTNQSKKKKPASSKDEPAHVGMSNTSQRKKAIVESIINGTWEIDDTKWEDFWSKVWDIDPDAAGRLDPERPMEIVHTDCGSSVNLEIPYDFATFKKHHNRCWDAADLRQKKLGMKSLDLFIATGPIQTPPDPQLPPIICAGLEGSKLRRVATLLMTTPAGGGGAHRPQHYAESLFGKGYDDLNKKERDLVQVEWQREWRWEFDHRFMVIRSTQCSWKMARRGSNDTRSTCGNCQGLLKDKSFQAALSKKRSADSANSKFINRRFLNPIAARLFEKYKGLEKLLDKVCLLRSHTLIGSSCLIDAALRGRSGQREV